MTLSFDCAFHRPPQHRDQPGFRLELQFIAGDGVTALWGPSGSGKTTVVQLIAGLLLPQRGRIVLQDRVLTDTDSRITLPPEDRQLGVVFQESLLFPHRSVVENLRYGERRRRATNNTSEPAVDFDRLVAVLELGDLLNRRPATLSGGQARRVALGRALLRSPRMLMLDEPLTGLDDELKDRIVDYLERVRDEWRIPMLLVTHERSTVSRLDAQVVPMQSKTAAENPT